MSVLDDLNKIIGEVKTQSLREKEGSSRFEKSKGGKPLIGGVHPSGRVIRQMTKPAIKTPEARFREKSQVSEKTERALFGILTSVLLIILGIISSREYLTLLGALAATLFFIGTAFSIFKFEPFSAKKDDEPKNGNIREEKIKALSEKLEKMDSSVLYDSIDSERIKILEDKVEELRAVAKSLVKALDEENKENEGAL